MTKKWETIIDVLYIVDLDYIDIDKIKLMLDSDPLVDEQVLDNLYMLKIISLVEYQRYMKKRIKHIEEEMSMVKSRIEDSKKVPEKFNPIIYYGFGSSYRGAAIENVLNK